MAQLISLAQAFQQWRDDVAPLVPKDDACALAESWNDYTDSLCKDGALGPLQYHYAPAWDDAMPDDGTRWDALKGDREFIVAAMGLTISATFIPFSQSRNKAEKVPSLNWSVTIKRDGREVIAADYMQGSAHCPAYASPSYFPAPSGAAKKRDDYTTRQRIAAECESGKVSRVSPALGTLSGRAIPPPELVDVLGCLLSDAGAIDCRDFADWCDDLGASADSISARATYDACMSTATKLRAAFGASTFEQLRELFADL